MEDSELAGQDCTKVSVQLASTTRRVYHVVHMRSCTSCTELVGFFPVHVIELLELWISNHENGNNEAYQADW